MFEYSIAFEYKSRLGSKGKFTTERITEHYELEFYKTSEGYSVVDGQKYPHKAGNVLFVRPNQKRYSFSTFECYAFLFDCKNKELQKKYLNGLPVCCYIPESKDIFAKVVFGKSINEISADLQVNAAVLEVISKIHENYPAYAPRDNLNMRHMKLVKDITDYIKENYNNQIDIINLCRSLFISRSLFFRAFKDITGCTPSEYINTVRIENAKKLLCDTTMPVVDIAYECGFGNQPYFNYMFRLKTSITPTQYRKNHLNRINLMI